MLENMLESLKHGGFSGWVIRVWDCKGTLMPYDDQTYEFEKRIENGEIVMFRIGNFEIPILKSDYEKWEKNKKLQKKVEAWFWSILKARGGGINISGFYWVYNKELERLNRIIAKYS